MITYHFYICTYNKNTLAIQHPRGASLRAAAALSPHRGFCDWGCRAWAQMEHHPTGQIIATSSRQWGNFPQKVAFFWKENVLILREIQARLVKYSNLRQIGEKLICFCWFKILSFKCTTVSPLDFTVSGDTGLPLYRWSLGLAKTTAIRREGRASGTPIPKRKGSRFFNPKTRIWG